MNPQPGVSQLLTATRFGPGRSSGTDPARLPASSAEAVGPRTTRRSTSNSGHLASARSRLAFLTMHSRGMPIVPSRPCARMNGAAEGLRRRAAAQAKCPRPARGADRAL